VDVIIMDGKLVNLNKLYGGTFDKEIVMRHRPEQYSFGLLWPGGVFSVRNVDVSKE
jgi:hypothetical protein